MAIIDVLNSPWAIRPDRMEEIHAIYAARMRGDELDVAVIEARIGKPLNNPPAQGYEVRDGAALIPLQGVLGQRMNMMSNISGGTSTELFSRDVRQAAADPAVKSIILMVDSPGGTVAGTQTAVESVRAVRGVKPVATFVEGMMASAAAWIGTAADVVVMDSATAQAGSIGVVATHTDVSKQQEALGVKTTEIVAGKYKRAASQYGALTETGQQVIQDQVDYLYSLFVADVAENRGVSTDQVLSNMADGRMFIGQQAIDAGLVDRITSLETLISELNANADQQDQRLQLSASFSMESPSQLAASWAAENPDAAALLRAEGGAVERDRIAAVRAQSMPGHEALIDQLAADGNTSGPEAAVQVLAAERALRANQSAVRLAESPEPVAFAPAPEAPAVQAEKPEPTPLEIAREARRIHGEEAAAGRQIAFTDAVAQAQSNLSA